MPIAPHLIGPLQQLMDGKAKLAPLISSVRGHPVNIHNWRSRVWNPAVKAACLDIEYGSAFGRMRSTTPIAPAIIAATPRSHRCILPMIAHVSTLDENA